MAETAEWHLECPDNCSLREGQPWSAQASQMLVDSVSYRKIVAAAAVEGVKLQLPTLNRHKKHIAVHGAAEPESAPVKATNIEILESIIQKGFENQKNWKPTISDTMKAMDMWFRLTQGNPFDELLDTLASASIGEDQEEEDNPSAISNDDERVDVIDPGSEATLD